MGRPLTPINTILGCRPAASAAPPACTSLTRKRLSKVNPSLRMPGGLCTTSRMLSSTARGGGTVLSGDASAGGQDGNHSLGTLIRRASSSACRWTSVSHHFWAGECEPRQPQQVPPAAWCSACMQRCAEQVTPWNLSTKRPNRISSRCVDPFMGPDSPFPHSPSQLPSFPLTTPHPASFCRFEFPALITPASSARAKAAPPRSCRARDPPGRTLARCTPAAKRRAATAKSEQTAEGCWRRSPG